MAESFDIDETLFSELVHFYGEVFHLPPMAAKIYAFLFFDWDREGTTFEDLLEKFGASKSSISTSLNLLLNFKLIKDLKPESRKRYFVTNEEFIKLRFQTIVRLMKTELDMIKRIAVYKKDAPTFYIENYEVYKALLENNIKNIENSLNQIYHD